MDVGTRTFGLSDSLNRFSNIFGLFWTFGLFETATQTSVCSDNGNEPKAKAADIALRDANFSYGKAAQDLKELLDHRGLKAAIILGHDWGSLLVQRFALLYPSYVSKLILVCIPYIPHDDVLVTLDQQAAVLPIVNCESIDCWLPFDTRGSVALTKSPRIDQRYFNTDKAETDINGDLEGFIDIFFRKGGKDKGGIGVEMLAGITPEVSIFEYAAPLNLTKSDLMSEKDVAEYVKFYKSIGGINGPLQWYRMKDQSFPEFVGKDKFLHCKTLFVGAEHDPFASGPWLEPMKAFVKDLTLKDVKDAGHW